MTRKLAFLAHLPILAAAGCVPGATEAPAPQSPPAISRTSEADRPAPRPVSAAKVSWETDRDRPFAEFLRDNSGGMIHDAAVGIEKRGVVEIKLDRTVAPDDTLALTKSVMAGARKDFPDRPITLAVFDPSGEPILKARFKPGQGVNYQIAHEPAASSRHGQPEAPAPAPTVHQGGGDPLARSGVTEADRKFVSWAEEHGKAYLRYVEADLERHNRLWFGVTREVKPADVPELTRSLLEGARKEFPKGELVANVFDPEGERIGRAHLATDGKINWEH